MAYSGSGSGTSGSPYEITSWAQLAEIKDYLSSHFILKTDLDKDSTGYSTYASTTANSGAGWLPIGTTTTAGQYFSGTLDGGHHTIGDIVINVSSGFTGLFGYLRYSTIKNLGVVNISITGTSGNAGAGGIVASGRNITITDCYTTGSISMTDTSFIGGIIGSPTYSAQIERCFSTMAITLSGSVRNAYCGGFAGYLLECEVEDCYATGAVNIGSSHRAAAFAADSSSAIVKNCYATGAVTGVNNIGGLIATETDSTTEDSFWDTQTTGKATSAGGTGKTTSEMKNINTYTDTATIGLDEAWDMLSKEGFHWGDDGVWFIDSGEDYPKLWYQSTLYRGESERNTYLQGEGSEFSKEDSAVLATNDTSLTVPFTTADYTKVGTDDNNYVSQSGVNNINFLFKEPNADAENSNFTITWKGKSSLAPSTSAVYLQIYNRDSAEWEALDSDNSTAADTKFTLTGGKSADLANYFDANFIVSARVYQDVS
jgi:hypothetical protein